MSAKRVAKRVAASIAMEGILEVVRGYLEELLRTVTPEDLYNAIQKDEDPWEHAPAKVKRRGSTWARKMRKYKDRLTPQLVLDWLHADRPDLHNLLINMGPKGTNWLTRMTEGIKNRIWPPEGGLKLIQEAPEKEDPLEGSIEQPEETPSKIRYI